MPHRDNQRVLLKGVEEECEKRKRKREKGAVIVCHTGATKGNFKGGRKRK